MAKKGKASKAGEAAMKARSNPYVQRVLEDEDLRENIVQAYESGRAAFARLSNGKSPTKQIFDDKKLQKDLKAAASSIRDASVALREAPKKQRKGGFGRVLLLGLAGGGLRRDQAGLPRPAPGGRAQGGQGPRGRRELLPGPGEDLARRLDQAHH